MNNVCIRELAETIGGQPQLGGMPPLGGGLEPVGRLVLDVERVAPGDLFWELTSDGSGSALAEQAFARGAQGVVTERRVEPWAGKFSIQVNDAECALRALGHWACSRFMGRVVVIAGSDGKTTTREMVDAVLRSKMTGSICSAAIDHPLAVALASLEFSAADEYGIVELLPLPKWNNDWASLTYMPVVVVTQLDQRWQGAVTDLLCSLPDEGVGILNGDDPACRQQSNMASNLCWFGRDDCEIKAADVRNRDGLLQFILDGELFEIPVWRRHELPATLAAYSVGRMMEIPAGEIANSLNEYYTSVIAA